jgi:transposase
MENGVEFDPIKVWEREDGRVWVVDGVHRIEASRRIGREYIEGEPLNIKDELHYRMEAIKHNLKHGLALRPEERKLCAQQLYLAGVDPVNIQRLFGVSDRTIRRWLSDIKSEKKEELREKIKELHKKGYGVREIARKLEIEPSTVSRVLQNGHDVQNATLTDNHSQQHKPDSYSLTHSSSSSVRDILDNPEKLVEEEEREIASAEGDIPEALKKFESPEMKAKVIEQIRRTKEREEQKKGKKLKTREEILAEIWKKLYDPLAEYQVRFCEDIGQRDFRLEDMLAFIDEIKGFFTTGRYLREKEYLDWLGYWRARKTEGYKQF